MLSQFFASFLKLAFASLLIGAGLSVFGVNLPAMLAHVGMTPEQAADMVRRGFEWAMPTALMGALVVVPLWALLNFLRPSHHE
jgi:hypothetical protein